MKRLLLLIIALTPLFDCNKNTIIVAPEDGNRPVITNVVPTSGLVSYPVAIHGRHFESDWWTNRVTFNSISAFPDSATDTIIYTRVPLRAWSGPLFVHTKTDSVRGPDFTVFQVCNSNLCITGYSGTTLTAAQSLVRNCFEEDVRWSGEMRGDTVILSQGVCVGDDSYRKKLLRFRHIVNDSMPQVFDGVYIKTEIYGTNVDTMKGLIAIQNWSVSDSVCGRVSWFQESSRNWWDFVFWYNFHH